MLKLINGQLISESDPNYNEYLKQEGSSSLNNSKYIEKEQTIPELTGGTNPVYSSNDIRENITSSGNQISQTEQDVLGGIDYNTELKNLLSSAKQINDFTSSEIQDIENAGRYAGDVVQSEIEKAEAAKKAGMGESTISGGRMGGFMNTQISGAAAVRSGVSDWAGAGGKLESFKSAYDANISDLTAKKAQAIELAKQARKEYIRTGKSSALTAVQNALTAAQSINAQIIQNQSAKVDLLSKASAEARTSKTYETTEAGNAIANMASAGLDASVIPQETKTKYESLMGLPAGTFDKFYDDIKLATQFSQEGRYVDFTKKITDILQTLPEGQSITINGKEYKGFGTEGGAKTSSIQEYEYYKKQEELAGRTPMSYEEYQNTDANRKQKALSAAGLDSTTQSQIIAAGNKFSSQPVVQRFAKAVEAKNFVDTLAAKDAGSLTSVDAQGLIYAFAKAMDPDSVVREGEYATAQKYSQSWLNAFGFNVERILAGKSFLSPDAVNNIKNVVNDKYNSTKTTYDTEYNKSKSLINSLSGGVVDPALYLTDYESAVGGTENNGGDVNNGTGADMSW